MIESLFRIVAAIKEASFAAEKVVAEIDDEIERLRRWIEVDQTGDFDASMAETRAELIAFSSKLRAEHSVSGNKSWSVYDTARLANIGIEYTREYFLFSKYVHGTISGIISQEHGVGRRLLLQNFIFIVLCAVGHAAPALSLSNAQDYIDRATDLLEEAIRLSKQGAFTEPDEP
jgi:hypothetical protein